ncbi:hypothetical protein HDV05_001231 [Chytridiales sp. JEL 0842]|nr:hypothetical protein HDV05_001231 [Chytridiales sp. JEL 0842]
MVVRRVVSELFMTVVSKKDYPEYYKVISDPIAIENIQSKLEKGEYRGDLPSFDADFRLMISNAMTFNRKGSEVYKDAQTLLSVYESVMPKDSTASKDKVVGYLDEIKSIFRKITNLKDDSGRLISEDFEELPDKESYPDYYESIKSPIALITMKQKISAKQYSSLEEFKSDFNLMIANAKDYNMEGSDIYNDAVTLEDYFIKITGGVSRDSVEKETPDQNVEQLESLEHNGEKYILGDYVYIANPNENDKPTIGQILSIFTTPDDDRINFVANWLLRPEQTVHKATQRFMENEVLKSNRSETYVIDDLIGRCWVLYVKDYVRGKPKGADMKHVYVCESRYNDQAKATSRIKMWNPKFKEPELELYETPIVPVKVASVFATEEILSKKRKQSEDVGSDIDVKASMDSNTMMDVDTDKDQTRRTGSLEPVDAPVSTDKKIRLTAKAENANNQTSGSSSTAGTQEPQPVQVKVVDDGLPFDRFPDGELKWYHGMPLNVIPRDVLVHSPAYLQYCAKNPPNKKKGALEKSSKGSAEPSLETWIHGKHAILLLCL